MLLSERARDVEQEILRRALVKLRAARELLQRALSDDGPAWEQETLRSAGAALERAIAIAESYLD